MRILEIAEGTTLAILISVDGHQVRIGLPVPDGWAGMTRQAKLQHCRDALAAHLATHTYAPALVPIYPDQAARDQAKDGFDALPGWATWTPAEAEDWIAANVHDLATAKQVLGRMAAAIMMLRDVVIER